jgi:hypothetical protein
MGQGTPQESFDIETLQLPGLKTKLHTLFGSDIV